MIDKLSNRQMIFGTFVLVMLFMSIFEISEELLAGEPLNETLDDISRFILSTVMAAVFCFEFINQRKAIENLKKQVNEHEPKLSNVNKETREVTNQYRAIVQKQFDHWNLTESEQEVVIWMLKGLSFREIAELRDTREKTVRQQASGVYRKAGVSSRYELAAWFFEDVLQPPEVVNSAK